MASRPVQRRHTVSWKTLHHDTLRTNDVFEIWWIIRKIKLVSLTEQRKWGGVGENGSFYFVSFIKISINAYMINDF